MRFPGQEINNRHGFLHQATPGKVQRAEYASVYYLTKAFDLVSRECLFQILPKIGCPPKLQSIIESFHNNMKGTVQFDGNLFDSFDICSGVKQGCVLALTLFGIFFSMLLKHVSGKAT